MADLVKCNQHSDQACIRVTGIMEVVGSAHCPFLVRFGNYTELSATNVICERSALALEDERMKHNNKPTTNVLPCVSEKDSPGYKGHMYWRRKYYKPVIICPSAHLENALPKSAISGDSSNGSEDPSLALEKHKGNQVLSDIGGVRSAMSISNVKGEGANILGLLYSADDSCSSSMINIDAGFALRKTEVDENGEGSSSGAFVGELIQEDKSEEDVCISIVKSHQQSCLMPDKLCISEDELTSTGLLGDLCACSVCGLPGTTEEMFVCDKCEESIHVSCSKPTKRKSSSDEWFCQSCLPKRRRIMKGKARKRSPATSKATTYSVDAMLDDSKPYTSSVRIGAKFQAVVPCWTGPLKENIDVGREPMKLDPCDITDFSSFHVLGSDNLDKAKPIGNWLQCQEVIVGLGESDGAICGKWRRAPLFEVQTDKWECFDSIFWDPKHADCAIPQELETEEVMRQLKYIETLKPRLEAKKRRLEAMEGYDSGKRLAVKRM